MIFTGPLTRLIRDLMLQLLTFGLSDLYEWAGLLCSDLDQRSIDLNRIRVGVAVRLSWCLSQRDPCSSVSSPGHELCLDICNLR